MRLAAQVSVLALLMTVGVAFAAEPQTMSDVQKRLNTIENIKVTAQKAPSSHAAPVTANVRKALDAAAAAEKK